jgi:hypothetical protein
MSRKTFDKAFESKNYTHKNTGAAHYFWSSNAKCEFKPKPPYLSGIVTYEDDQ